MFQTRVVAVQLLKLLLCMHSIVCVVNYELAQGLDPEVCVGKPC